MLSIKKALIKYESPIFAADYYTSFKLDVFINSKVTNKVIMSVQVEVTRP
jgi:hypothetical protein